MPESPFPTKPPDAFLHEGVWLPRGETHLTDLMRPFRKRFQRDQHGRATYQRHKLAAAMELVRKDRRRRAVDIGAHVGLWATGLEDQFDEVICFEPAAQHAAILPFNMRTNRWKLHQVALGNRKGDSYLGPPINSSGDRHLTEYGGESVKIRTLDSYRLTKVDFVKIDVEGFENQVVMGARQTLARCKPIIVIEQKGKDKDNFASEGGEALALLHDLGFEELRKPWSGDHFLGFAE